MNFSQAGMAEYRRLMIWELLVNLLAQTEEEREDDALMLGIDRIEMNDFGTY